VSQQEQNLLIFLEHPSSLQWGSCFLIFSFLCIILFTIVCPFDHFPLAFVFSITRIIASNYPFGIFTLFLECATNVSWDLFSYFVYFTPMKLTFIYSVSTSRVILILCKENLWIQKESIDIYYMLLNPNSENSSYRLSFMIHHHRRYKICYSSNFHWQINVIWRHFVAVKQTKKPIMNWSLYRHSNIIHLLYDTEVPRVVAKQINGVTKRWWAFNMESIRCFCLHVSRSYKAVYVQKMCLTPPLFIEVPVPRHENDRSYVFVFWGIEFASVSMICFPLDFGTVQIVRYFLV
jgi:hypothetical protein